MQLPKVRLANDVIRHIYDKCTENFCMVLAFTATAAELTTLFSPPVMDRADTRINLQNMDQQETIDFISTIINKHRVEETTSDNLFPFNEEAMQEITSQLTSIKPRKIINNMQSLIESVRLSDHPISPDSPINLDVINNLSLLDQLNDNG